MRTGIKHGIFLVSLDFELSWGLIGNKNISRYNANLEGVRTAIPLILDLFNENNIHATWATVGFLFFQNANELKKNLPEITPGYDKKHLSPYEHIKKNKSLPFNHHFAPDLINLIRSCEGQEIGTHTFSHYLCCEKGQNIEEFEQDMAMAIEVARKNNLPVNSLVFPRNQCNDEYLDKLKSLNIKCYRGCGPGCVFNDNSKKTRMYRLLDTYLNVSGHRCYNLNESIINKPFDFYASSFLRPWSRRFAVLDKFRLNRHVQSMTYAAKNNLIYHIYWHPHNFGTNTKENLRFLRVLISKFDELRKTHNMQSLNMQEICVLAYKHQKEMSGQVQSP